MPDLTVPFLLTCCVLCVNFLTVGVEASLPEVPSLETVNSREPLEVAFHGNGKLQNSILNRNLNRLPGVCRRLRRRRITVLCNMGNYCSAKEGSQGQVCRCPRGSKCKQFFLKSL